jgi:DNA uptake protein ComE-like DNA-binding protein
MRSFLRSFFSYSKTEKWGFIGLFCLFILLVAVRFTMSLWVHPPKFDTAEQQALTLAWEQYKQTCINRNAAMAANMPVADATLLSSAALFAFDPNTIDSLGLSKLGLRKNTIHIFLNYRKKGAHFYTKEDFKKVWSLTAQEYARLEPYIQIPERNHPAYKASAYTTNKPVFLNTADSLELISMKGIGPVLAHKIIGRRNALGGFFRPEQLLEIYPFPDSTFQTLKQSLLIDTNAVTKLNLNTATEAQLQAHPYIGTTVARNILLYRNGLQGFQTLEQLREVPLMNEEIYRKIVPYFIIE